MKHAHEHHAGHHHGNISSDMQTDPVCGMSVNPETAKHKTSYKKENYYFCAENCLKKFKADPEKYPSPQELTQRLFFKETHLVIY